MNTYFKALVRASGHIPLGAWRASEPVAPLESIEETRAPAVTRPPRRTIAPADRSVAVETEESGVAEAAQIEQHTGRPVISQIVAAKTATPHTEAPLAPPRFSATENAPEEGIVRPADSDTPAAATQGIDLVRTAIRWVRRDPGLAAGPAPSARHRDVERATPVRTPEPIAVEVEPPPVATREPVRPEKPSRAPQLPVEPVRETRPQRRSAIPVSPPPVELPRHAARHAAPPEPDSVEVSIGAIHIKMDPPAAPPPAPRQRPQQHITPRPSLARRALRRL